MKGFIIVVISAAALISILLLLQIKRTPTYCFSGAFLADSPTKDDITDFNNRYGKKPLLVLVFVDWGNFVDEQVVNAVYNSDCILFLTWEPWQANLKQGIDFARLLSGEYDAYIKEFASKLKAIDKTVFIRFCHEMNGDWYPWSGIKTGRDKFRAAYRYVKDIFDSETADNLKWVFSINWQDVPEQNDYSLYYPGDNYVDYIGIDGYNWGNTQAWSNWMSFERIFLRIYREVTSRYKKPILISEFGSTSSGGDKAEWIRQAMQAIKRMKNIKAFVLFNVDKETNWGFPVDSAAGIELKRQLESNYFKDKGWFK